MLRRTAMKRRTRYKPVELERYHEWIAKENVCLVCGGAPTVHHVRGYADRPGSIPKDHWLVVPLCPPHHQKVYDPKASDPVSVEGLGHQGFFEKYGIDLLAEAMALAESYQRKDAA